MTTSTTPSRINLRNSRGFTLPEVIIAGALGSIVMAGVIASSLFLIRSGVTIVGYHQMEAQARRGIEEFSRDLRMAEAVTWNSSRSITLTVPGRYTSNGNEVTYVYDNGTFGPTAKAFYSKPGDASANTPKTKLTANVSTFGYAAYDRIGNLLGSPASTPDSIKRIQLSMTLHNDEAVTVDQSSVVVSASFVLRNKPSN